MHDIQVPCCHMLSAHQEDLLNFAVNKMIPATTPPKDKIEWPEP